MTPELFMLFSPTPLTADSSQRSTLNSQRRCRPFARSLLFVAHALPRGDEVGRHLFDTELLLHGGAPALAEKPRVQRVLEQALDGVCEGLGIARLAEHAAAGRLEQFRERRVPWLHHRHSRRPR